MIYNRAISNGPACASAEWLMELIAMEVEGAYPDDCLPTLAPVFVAPISKGPSTQIAKAVLGADEARLLAGSAQAAVVTCG